MDSSDGSFAWTDASNSDSEDSDMAHTQHVNGDLHETESDSGKTYKNKLHQKLFKDHEHQENSLEEIKQPKNAKKRKIKEEKFDHYENHDSPKKKRIKIEPQSDTDQGRTNKKLTRHIDVNDSVNDSCISQINDERELSMKIKQEQSSFTSPTLVKNKKSKENSNSYNLSTNEQVKKEDSISSCNLNDSRDFDRLNSNDNVSRNKKSTKHKDVHDDSCKSQFDDEMELSTIIKQEQSSFASPTPVKKKKNKKENSYNMSTNELDEKEYSTSSTNLNGSKDFDHLNSLDAVNRNKKYTKHMDVHDDLCKSQSDDESELSMIIKQEQSSFASPTPVKKKKSKKEKKIMSSNEPGEKEGSISSGNLNDSRDFEQSTIDNVNDDEPQESDDVSVHKKRKKKKKDKECIDKYEIIIDKFEAEETVVELPEKKKKRKHSSNENIGANRLSETLTQRNFTNGVSESESVDKEKKLNFSDQDMAIPAVPSVQKTHTKRTSKMSDRIVFEEDNTDTETKAGDKESYEIFTKYLKRNVDLKPITLKPNDDCGITENDDIWVMKCPVDLDTKALAGVDLKLNGKCKVKIDGQKYEGNVEDKEDDSVHILTYKNKRFSIKKFPLKGTIALKKKIPVIKTSTEITQTMVHNNITTRQPLIYDTKSWHPFFGSDFHKHIEPRSEVSDCLDSPMPVSPIKKKKKKRNKEKCTEMETTHEEENNSKLEVEIDVQPKNKKKRRRSIEETPEKKTKRQKKDPDSADVWESEKAIEENLFNF